VDGNTTVECSAAEFHHDIKPKGKEETKNVFSLKDMFKYKQHTK
jgi:hypothetical protein